MAAFVKFQNFVRDLGDKVHHLQATGDTLKVYLTNNAPNAGTHEVTSMFENLKKLGNQVPQVLEDKVKEAV
jgi:hypothetical protein